MMNIDTLILDLNIRNVKNQEHLDFFARNNFIGINKAHPQSV